jgi:hypothetical protein
MRELGDNLTPEQVTKMLKDGAHLLLQKPETIIEPGGEERPLSKGERQSIASAFIQGSVARLSQWWREDERDNVMQVLNALEESSLRVTLTVAVPDIPPA